jgi:DNA mismatch endonuclease (patch repair protein)
VCVPPIRGVRRSADVVFTRQLVAVFVDGCFWHGCPDHYVAPKRNAGYWSAKVATNRARDAATNQRLVVAGWRVFRIWEHEPPWAAADAIEALVRANQAVKG